MSLKTKLYLLGSLLHTFFLLVTLYFHKELGGMLLVAELVLISSLLVYFWLVRRGVEPIEYSETFSNLLKEEEFTSRFTKTGQKDLNKLLTQYNAMLSRLYQERLEVGERRSVFEQLMKESPIGVVLLDFENNISQVNPAAEYLFAIRENEIIGSKLALLSGQRIGVLNNVPAESQKLLSTENGHQLKISHHCFLDRGFTRSFYMVQEMTSEIAQSQKRAYDKLIRLMSHEVNNTIAITNSLLESCINYQSQLDADSQEDFSNALNVVIDRSKSLNHFMQAYANVVKLPKPIKSRFNLTKLLKNLTTLFYAQAKQQNVTIQFSDENDYFVKADPNLIEQALVNILKNALESIGSNGLIEVSLQMNSESLELTIKDDGEGISEQTKEQLFTPFFTTKTSGQGVGLMLINEIFTSHDYSYSLTNNKVSKGACFKVQIAI
ncbi:PAS domain-containing sensor histidine kinase [Aliikangiella sp. G2MR2-5]|uniref:sensor histidine kinase n=1 Tax=Aliikangiella sp. G2MR2-5 TaxID=2788943 RepID=UPI0018A897D8|nr:ATP-binding protein [Aliikangiella sp. G2MR2-5]